MLLESVASIGILFFFYSRARLGHVSPEQKRALNITVGGMSLPFVFGIGLALILCKIVAGTNEVDFARFLIFISSLLTPHIDGTAMIAIVFNDVDKWILLTLAIVLASDDVNNHVHKSPFFLLRVLLSGMAC
ncbi:Cation/H(+) antiporter 17 [Glycine max]|nr:Cation/H(+) antiporter 17 [Glycine max]